VRFDRCPLAGRRFVRMMVRMNKTRDEITLPSNTITLADAQAVLATLAADSHEHHDVAQLVEEMRPTTAADFLPESPEDCADDIGKSRAELNGGSLTRTAIAGRSVVLAALLAAGRKALGL
jgi:hypothetical protein